jgi:hypothetical protein
MPSTNTPPRSPVVPPAHDWRTTDEDEIHKRALRAREERFQIRNLTPEHPVFSNFAVQSGSGRTYSVEFRDAAGRESACDCVDFRSNGLGFCKHVEAVRLHLAARHKRLFKEGKAPESDRLDVVVDAEKDTLWLKGAEARMPARLRRWFRAGGCLAAAPSESTVDELRKVSRQVPALRLSQEIEPWLEERRRAAERQQLRHEYELKVQSGEWPPQETTVPLFPYQREGMLHLAFTERALLADEMGLGKTIQAIAACALLHRLGKARRVLVVTPASLKTEWEEQIRRFTKLDYQLVFGGRVQRLRAYTPQEGSELPFFTLVNYEQMVGDALDVNERLRPDVVVLDEAQRIKNWGTKTAQAVKRLRSRYAFVLTGTPIENRIDELHSLMDFLNPSVLGPLFRFNRDFYQLDERGRPVGCRNLSLLHERIRPFLLRRRKADVETELPERTDHNHMVPMSPLQRSAYAEHEYEVTKLASAARRRPLTRQEQEKLQRELAMMRMICDTNYILDPKDRTCPKLAELEKVLDECIANDSKVIVFSEWERMLELVRNLCRKRGIGCAWHTGSVPQLRRRAEINAFKQDPGCRVFLSTDSGATGLNLQNASVVINCDLPWNPAKLEQRIARAWRKLQTKPVTVVNLISEDTIEHRMLETLATKQTIAQSVLDRTAEATDAIPLRGGRQAFVARLEQLVAPSALPGRSATPVPQTHPDPAAAFADQAARRLRGALVHCEERYPAEGNHSVIVAVVDRDAPLWQEALTRLHAELLGPGRSDPLSPVRLEVMDRATHEAIERLEAAGLLSSTVRTSRPLMPGSPAKPATRTPLTPEEQARADAHVAKATRMLKMAQLLGEGGLADEARPSVVAAIVSVGCRMAVAERMAEPTDPGEVLRPPLQFMWGPTLRAVRDFVGDPAADWRPAVSALRAKLAEWAR